MQNHSYNPEQIDSDIRRLLFANPSLGMRTCRDIVKALKSKTDEEKVKLRSWLEENVTIFKNKAREMTGEPLRHDLKEHINKHIDFWEGEFGEVSLSDIGYLTESTDIKLVDIGWERGKISPVSIMMLLDEFMVGQEKYKQELGLTVYTHLLRVRRPELNIPKSNLLVYGPSGAGKTSGVKILSDKLGINHGIVNFERVVPDGIVGTKITDPLTRTLDENKDDIILIGDEADKIHDEEVQHELLSILDDKNMISYPTSFNTYSREYREIPSKNITCILCGKYDSLIKTVKKRLNVNRVGFGSEGEKVTDTNELYAQVNLNDLKEVLGSDEICGRIGSFVGIKKLNIDDFICIMLNKRDSIYKRYQALFSANQTKLELTMEGAREIASIAITNYKDLGVRGLEIVFRQLLREDMLKIGDSQAQDILINKEYICSHLNQGYVYK